MFDLNDDLEHAKLVSKELDRILLILAKADPLNAEIETAQQGCEDVFTSLNAYKHEEEIHASNCTCNTISGFIDPRCEARRV